MFTGLRSQLLASYFVVITAALVVVAAALLGFATLSSVRYLPALQRLATLSLSNGYELLQLRDLGLNSEQLRQFLDETAAAQNVRILVADTPTRQIVYDSNAANSWTGDTIANINRPQLRLDPFDDSIFGLFRHPDGSRWLVYARATPEFGRSLVFYAQPEPTPFSFFQNFFFQPLLVAGVIAFIISILLAAGITRSVARPLRRMASAAEAIAQGNYDQKLLLEGPHEVQRVATSFNSMAMQVKATQQSQRDFLANVSHDLKTPITSIQGWSQALIDGTAVSPTEQQQAAQVIHTEATRMARMVAQLLALARLESGEVQLHREHLHLRTLLDDGVTRLAPRTTAAQVIVDSNIPTQLTIEGDVDQLTELFNNLLDNAIRFTPAGGEVSIAAKLSGANEIEITIHDQGPGIATEALPRIFERFYQVEKSRTHASEQHGVGLGLAIAREIVEAHHGRIQVRSEPGAGTTFYVYLPNAETTKSDAN